MNKETLTSAFTKLHARLLAKAKSVVGNDDDARDILQEAFCRLWSSPSLPDTDTHAAGMLSRTVRNLSIDSYRHSKTVTLCDIDDSTESVPITEDNIEQTYNRVNAIIEHHLDKRAREILIKRDRDGWSFEELADHYNTTEANVRMIVARARRTVRNIYNDTLI